MHRSYAWLLGQGRKLLEFYWVRLVVIGLMVTLFSELYLLPDMGGVRFSGAAILYQILLCKMVPNRRFAQAGLVTAGIVWLFRILWRLAGGGVFADVALLVAPGALFYLCYDILFYLLLPPKKMGAFRWFWLAGFLSDVLSNIFELSLSTGFAPHSREDYSIFLAVALFRSLCAMVALGWLGYYRRLLVLHEQEQRYQRLFLMKAQLKDELYFLKKTAEEIERVMGKAYCLYERLEEDTEQRQLALDIARDVHEVKKDHMRILKGIEAEVTSVSDREAMSVSELLGILRVSTEKTLQKQQAEKIRLTIQMEYNFLTEEHYRLMSILRNLVTNAVEAMEQENLSGSITVGERLDGADVLLWVEDDGPGIPEKMRDKVFQIGYSTKFNPVTGDMNRGVGLAVITTMTQELGGSVTLKAKEQRGCCFSVRIPRERLVLKDEDLYRRG